MSQAPPTHGRPGRSPAESTGADGGFPIVGIVGAGQLARMCQPPAVALAVSLSVLARSASESAALVIPAAAVGDHDDLAAVRRLADTCDVVTFDHEHVPADVLAALDADGAVLHPRPGALRYAQDKLAMRDRLTELGIPSPRWRVARTADDLDAFAGEVGWPLIAKTPRGGYDGKGVRRLTSPDDAADWLELAGEPGPLADGVLVEESVPFTREVAALVARNPSGDVRAWPVVETVQSDGICTEVLAPAPSAGAETEPAAELATRIATELDVTGVLAVELFEVPGDDGVSYVVNELAMRPHNSGHWTIEGSVTSQFEQHLRAVLDLPLGDTAARAPWTVMANVLGGPRQDLYAACHQLMATDPGLRVHLYGKDVRPGRKIGHVTVYGDDLDALRTRARHAATYLQGDTA